MVSKEPCSDENRYPRTREAGCLLVKVLVLCKQYESTWVVDSGSDGSSQKARLCLARCYRSCGAE